MPTDRTGRPMSQMDICGDEIGARCGWWFRSAWSGSRRKNLANLLGISDQQAKRLLGGARPTSEQIEKLARHFGWRFLAFVFEGIAGPPPVTAELAELRAAVEKTQQEIAHVAARLDTRPMAPVARETAEPTRDAAEPASGGAAGSGRRDLARAASG